MLARLLRCVIAGAAIFSLLALWHGWRQGRPVGGVVAAVAVLLGYATVLGLEFLLLHLTHGSDSTPRPTARALVRAWGHEILSGLRVLGWRLPFRSRHWPDHLPADGAGRRGVLLVHGLVCNRGIWNGWLRRFRRRGVPVIAVNLEPVFGSIDDYIPLIEAAVQRLERCTGLPPVAVGHSMGGLVLRRWWAAQEFAGRLHHAVTIATPHGGTWMARFAMTANARQMRNGSTWLTALDAGEAAADRAGRCTCFYSECDNMVFPPSRATWMGADNRRLPGIAHVQMADRPEPWAEVLRLLDGPVDLFAVKR